MDSTFRLGTLCQIARSVGDLAAARAWYSDVLGLNHLYTFGNLVFFDCDGVRLMLSEAAAPAQDSILYFRVDDVRSAAAALTARGVSFIQPPHVIHRHDNGAEEWMAFFEDHEARPLAIMSQSRPAQAGD